MKRLRKTLNRIIVLSFVAALFFALPGCISYIPLPTSSPTSSISHIEQTNTVLPSNIPTAATGAQTLKPILTATPPTVTDEIAADNSDFLPLSGRIIGLDPGHQANPNDDEELISPNGTETKPKVQEGTYGRFTGVYEYVVNLQVAHKLKTQLELLGATVVMTRETSDIDISNAQRATMMNDILVDCWLRIHTNGDNDASVNGLFFLVPSENTMNTADPSVQLSSLKLAQTLLPPVIAATGAKDLGVDFRDDQTGFSWSSVPVCTIEMGYMTNEVEDHLLITSEYQNKIVEGLTAGFLAYFSQSTSISNP